MSEIKPKTIVAAAGIRIIGSGVLLALSLIITYTQFVARKYGPLAFMALVSSILLWRLLVALRSLRLAQAELHKGDGP